MSSGLTLSSPSIAGAADSVTAPTVSSTAALAQGGKSPGKIQDTAQAFESSFLSIMLGQMFEGVETAAPFGGGDSEKMFRSFFSDAIAKQMTKAGGIGLASSVSREMLKLQGLQ